MYCTVCIHQIPIPLVLLMYYTVYIHLLMHCTAYIHLLMHYTLYIHLLMHTDALHSTHTLTFTDALHSNYTSHPNPINFTDTSHYIFIY